MYLSFTDYFVQFLVCIFTPAMDARRSRVVNVEAVPLFAILNALGNPSVDYFRS